MKLVKSLMFELHIMLCVGVYHYVCESQCQDEFLSDI